MSKPDEIPDDVWEAAIRCAGVALRNMPDDYGDLTTEVSAIARAIMAAKAEQREADAQIAEGIGHAYGEDETGWLDCSETVAAHIRAGGV